MAKKRETKRTTPFLKCLQRWGYFRNISDKFQIGLPDIIGSFRGIAVGIEVKAVGIIPPDGLTPEKKDHRFTKEQVKELFSLQDDGVGIGLGVIICGSHLFWFTPEYINDDGQVDCNRLQQEGKFVVKNRMGTWMPFLRVLEDLWARRMSALKELET